VTASSRKRIGLDRRSFSMSKPYDGPSEGEYQSWQSDPITDALAEQSRARAPVTKSTWTTREGQVIRVVDMIDIHLINTVAMIRRAGIRHKEIYAAFLVDATHDVGGDGALDCLEQESRDLDGTPLDAYIAARVACFPLMLKELARRKLVAPGPTDEEVERAIRYAAMTLLQSGLGRTK